MGMFDGFTALTRKHLDEILVEPARQKALDETHTLNDCCLVSEQT